MTFKPDRKPTLTRAKVLKEQGLEDWLIAGRLDHEGYTPLGQGEEAERLTGLDAPRWNAAMVAELLRDPAEVAQAAAKAQMQASARQQATASAMSRLTKAELQFCHDTGRDPADFLANKVNRGYATAEAPAPAAQVEASSPFSEEYQRISRNGVRSYVKGCLDLGHSVETVRASMAQHGYVPPGGKKGEPWTAQQVMTVAGEALES